MDIVLFGPHQIHGEMASTEAGYRLCQRAILKRNGRGAKKPGTNTRGEPWAYLGDPPEMYISGGKCVIDCANCKNSPAVNVELRLALCCECGAVYTQVTVPDAETLETLEAIFAHRPIDARNTRAPFSTTQETLEELDIENVERGLPATLPDTAATVLSRRQSRDAETKRRKDSMGPDRKHLEPGGGKGRG